MNVRAMPACTRMLGTILYLAWHLIPLAHPVFGGNSQQFFSEDRVYAHPRLNFSSPSPLIFHSTFALLQQWPNTFFPNGHTIAPCTIAKNTNLYHARADSSFPPSPEWFAFDAEMSYAIAGVGDTSHLYTFRTTQDVKCLYFDGTSASLMDDGSMDAQMLLIHNNSAHVPDHPAFTPFPGNNSYGLPPCPPGSPNATNCTHWNPLKAEYDRAEGLCDFLKEHELGGPGWGYEGVVRMNAGFELIWCNFSSPSARLVSRLNVSVPMLDGTVDIWPQAAFGPTEDHAIHFLEEQPPEKPPRKGVPSDRGRPRWSPWSHPFFNQSIFEWFHVAADRYGFSGGRPGRGEARVRINSCGFFNFYEPSLVHQETIRIQSERSRYNISTQGHWLGPASGTERAQALQELTRRRRTQRVTNVSVSDGLYMKRTVQERLTAALDPQRSSCSGTDWVLIAQELVTSYADRLRVLTAALRNVADAAALTGSALRDSVAHIRTLLHSVWMPYYEYPQYSNSDIDTAFDLAAPHSRDALARCQHQYERITEEDIPIGEEVTSIAVSEVTSSICNTLLLAFLETEQLWLTHMNNASVAPPDQSSSVYHHAVKQAGRHLRAIEELMTWLGWAEQWTACSPGCGLGETCYIPMWPALGIGRGPSRRNDSGSGYPRRGGWTADTWEQLLWEPRCVSSEHFPTR